MSRRRPIRTKIQLDAGWAQSEDDFDDVVIGDRVVARRIAVVLPGAAGQPRLEWTIDSSTGVPRCVEVRLAAAEGGEIRTRDLRIIELESWLGQIVPLFMNEITRRDDGAIESVVRVPDVQAKHYRDAQAVLREARSAGRRKVTDELLQRVAEVYRSDSDRPGLAVQRAFAVKQRTAFRYIAQARERGLLEPKEA